MAIARLALLLLLFYPRSSFASDKDSISRAPKTYAWSADIGVRLFSPDTAKNMGRLPLPTRILTAAMGIDPGPVIVRFDEHRGSTSNSYRDALSIDVESCAGIEWVRIYAAEEIEKMDDWAIQYVLPKMAPSYIRSSNHEFSGIAKGRWVVAIRDQQGNTLLHGWDNRYPDYRIKNTLNRVVYGMAQDKSLRKASQQEILNRISPIFFLANPTRRLSGMDSCNTMTIKPQVQIIARSSADYVEAAKDAALVGLEPLTDLFVVNARFGGGFAISLRYPVDQALAKHIRADTVDMFTWDRANHRFVPVATSERHTDIGVVILRSQEVRETIGILGSRKRLPDTTPPETQFTFDGPHDEDFYKQIYITPATRIGFEISDVDSRGQIVSGPGMTRYCVDASTSDLKKYENSFALSIGKHELKYMSSDAAGNVESVQSAVVFVTTDAAASEIELFGPRIRSRKYSEEGDVVAISTCTRIRFRTWGRIRLSSVACILEGMGVGRSSCVGETFTLSEGTYTITHRAIDKLGNIPSWRKLTLIVASKPIKSGQDASLLDIERVCQEERRNLEKALEDRISTHLGSKLRPNQYVVLAYSELGYDTRAFESLNRESRAVILRDSPKAQSNDDGGGGRKKPRICEELRLKPNLFIKGHRVIAYVDASAGDRNIADAAESIRRYVEWKEDRWEDEQGNLRGDSFFVISIPMRKDWVSILNNSGLTRFILVCVVVAYVVGVLFMIRPFSSK